MTHDSQHHTDEFALYHNQRGSQMNMRERITEDQAVPEPHTTRRLIDIHVYNDLPEGDTCADRTAAPIEAYPDDAEEHTAQDTQEQETQEPMRQAATRHYYRRPPVLLVVLAGCLCLVLTCVLVVLWVFPAFAPAATITIVPVSRVVTTTSTLTIVTGPASTTVPSQITGRQLAAVTMSQQKRVATTGTAQQNAQNAHGTVTFYNALPAAQTIAAGQLLTGADGVQVVTDQDAMLPAGTLATNGQVSVAAHAVQAGPTGNIGAHDIYGACCRVNVFVQNDAAFTGGQLARTYQTATPQDLSSATASLKASLDQSIQAALQTQIQNGESVLLPLDCQSQVSSDHQPGDEAAQVTITINETCTALAYKTAALHDALMRAISQQAARLGEGFTSTSDLDIHVIHVQADDQATATIQVKATQTYGYQFSQEQQQQLKNRIAGKGKDEATTLLLHASGVQTVSIHFDPGMTTMPVDVNHIRILFLIG